EFYVLVRSGKQLMPAVWLILGLACVSSITAATFGTFLSWTGGYDPTLIFWHKWLGIGLAGLTVLAVILRMKTRPGATRKWALSYWMVLMSCGVVLVLAAHNGASLTHGSNFLTEHMPEWMGGDGEQKSKAKFVTSSGGDFGTKIYSILESDCIGCHGAEKQKGGLRVDSREALLAGGESGKGAIVSGNALASEMVRRVLLPAEDDDAMPPEGKARVRPEHIVDLIHWIDVGAPWGVTASPVKSLIVDEKSEPSGQKLEGSTPSDTFFAKNDKKSLVQPLNPQVKREKKVEKVAEKVVVAKPAEDVESVALELGADAKTGDSKHDFPDKIWPIIKASCISCHGPDKQKGKLRLDTPDWIKKGSDGEPVIIAGNLDDSEFYYRIILPADDDDIMPAKGDPLTKEQIELIRKWIEKGASFEGWDPSLVVAGVGKAAKVKPETLLEKIAKAVSPASAEALAGLGDLSMPIALDSPLLRVDFQFFEGEVTEELLAKLHGLDEQITWVNLKGSKITDSGLEHLSKLPNLTRLHLENTEISDAGLVHLKGLVNLQYLNLYKTKVSDGGLKHLVGLKNLEKLYLWQSEVTDEGAAELKKSLPKLDINLGWKAQAAVKQSYEFSFADFFDLNSCCFKANAEKKSCEHPCCKEAAEQKRVCIKCNSGAEAKLLEAAVSATAALPEQKEKIDYLSVFFDAGSCCSKAHEKGGSCEHPCCIASKVHTTVCAKCNAGALKKLNALSILSGQPLKVEPK
ncbi:MAG: hypothetical protein IID32_06130, partial [Planctomycetes bacterium]|nr:hypothetical protein [Planctomycetota bacterium]